MNGGHDRPAATAWSRIEPLFAAALELPSGARTAFLQQACDGDAELLARVSGLLDVHDRLESQRSDPFLAALDPARAAVLLYTTETEGGEDDDTAPGAVIGRYRLLRPLGRGGMGVVHLAHDPLLDRPVALKFLPPHTQQQPDGRDRLLEEARAASALDHPNIGTVYEVGSAADRRYVAMACYDGGTLRDRLAGGPLAVDTAVAIALQVAHGLAAAHERGIVHRDIKPENLVFDGRDLVKIVDFGLATMNEDPGAHGGTVVYMSPAQLRREPADPAADVWSLGVVLYEMLTGARPFAGHDRQSVATAIERGAVPVRELRPEIPVPVADAVMRCLDVSSAASLTSAADLAAALSAAVAPTPVRLTSVALLSGSWLAASWLVLHTATVVTDRFLLPGWLRLGLLAVLLAGLPLLIAAAIAGPRRSQGTSSAAMARRHDSRSWRSRWWPRMSWARTAAAGIAACAVLVLSAGWVVVRGDPRITQAQGHAGNAFGQRGWVVLADFDAAADSRDLATALREALAVDLQQSRFVNVVDRARMSAVLGRMGYSADTHVAAPIALELAERAGAGAVVTATVSRAGTQYLLSGRALEPATGRELFAVRTAAGPDRLLGAVEQMSREIRRRLGESREQLRGSRPLPEVTTGSLEALRLYAEAERQIGRDNERALALLAAATRADSTFAMAYRLAGAAASSQLRFGEAMEQLSYAYHYRDRLPERERWHIEAFHLQNVVFDPAAAAARYQLLLSRYPDDMRAANNLGGILQSWLGDHEGAYAALRHARELDPVSAVPLSNAIFAASILGENEEAGRLIAAADSLGMHGLAARSRVALAFAAGAYDDARAACAALLAASPGPATAADDLEVCGSMDVATGRLAAALPQLEAVQRSYLRDGRHRNFAHVAHALAVADMMRGETARAAARLAAVTEQIPAGSFPEPDRFITRINLRVHAELLGRGDISGRVAAAYPPYPDATHWFGRMGESLVTAAAAVHAGNGEAALDVLRRMSAAGLEPIGWRIWSELLHGMAFEALGDFEQAATHFRRAANPGFLTVPALAKDRIHLPIALAGLVRAETARGHRDAATDAQQRLRLLLADADAAASPASAYPLSPY